MRNITKIDLEKNAFKRNENDKIRLAVKSTIDAFNCFDRGSNLKEDISEGAIGWHGADILTATGETRKDLERDLYIADNLKKETKFNSWTNPNPNKSWIYIGFKIYKGSGNFGPTVFYKKIKK